MRNPERTDALQAPPGVSVPHPWAIALARTPSLEAMSSGARRLVMSGVHVVGDYLHFSKCHIQFTLQRMRKILHSRLDGTSKCEAAHHKLLLRLERFVVQPLILVFPCDVKPGEFKPIRGEY